MQILLDLDLTLMNNWRDNYYLESDYDSKTKLSIIILFAYIDMKNRQCLTSIWNCFSIHGDRFGEESCSEIPNAKSQQSIFFVFMNNQQHKIDISLNTHFAYLKSHLPKIFE